MTQLNSDQQKASDELFRFLLDPEAKEFAIKGPAGVGKTYLLQHLRNHILQMYKDACQLLGSQPIDYEVVLTATTNKAADVLAGSLGIPTQTIHSYFRLRVKDDYETGKSTITKTRDFVVFSKKLIIIDEASMVDKALYKIIHEGTNKTCKIIYVGDPCQLAPVGESLSPVFDPTIPSVELNIPVRNSGQPALMALCKQLRENVKTVSFQKIQEVPGVIERLTGPQFQQHVQTNFLPEDNPYRLLAYTNKIVKAYNGFIRQVRGLTNERLVKGERVINNSAFEYTYGNSRDLLPAEREYEVIRVDSTDQEMDFLGVPVKFYLVEIGVPKSAYGVVVKQPLDQAHVKSLIDFCARQKDWYSMFRLKGMFPDLRQKDCSTVHKSQGSTFDAVYIDLSNIGTCTIAEQTARMLYVAASRATTKIYLYGELPERYYGKNG